MEGFAAIMLAITQHPSVAAILLIVGWALWCLYLPPPWDDKYGESDCEKDRDIDWYFGPGGIDGEHPNALSTWQRWKHKRQLYR